MPVSFTLQELHDVGGWTFAALCLAALLGAFIKGMIVPRFLYDEQKERLDKTLEQQNSIIKSLDALARSIDNVISALIGRK